MKILIKEPKLSAKVEDALVEVVKILIKEPKLSAKVEMYPSDIVAAYEDALVEVDALWLRNTLNSYFLMDSIGREKETAEEYVRHCIEFVQRIKGG